ncbi:hypothetical protein ACFSKU_19835 [Pontibacter silvestris]|uniref:Uncharacterized protein n=1 Tax=Pontibacter silvestris TaxID=2305183 RepID=A0ABW4X2B8_9BACT|nr:hypothetical protein [Pontibacter silvestris]MCC9134862.1 hypothetical protein [Pontibacter silvestris]
MPVSRNRKKKNNQNNNNKPRIASPMCIHELFQFQFNNCRKCGRARDKFEYDELPKEEQLHWDKAGIQQSIDFILYCPSCEEYSALLKTEEF